jgi:hypothetical protein
VQDLPGVGTNLQGHYETITIITSNQPWKLLEGCTFLTPGTDDACFAQYSSPNPDKGPYATNFPGVSALLSSSLVPRAKQGREHFIVGGPVKFKGHFQGYTSEASKNTNHWTWAILKAYEKSILRAVALRFIDPLDIPNVNFSRLDAGWRVDDTSYNDDPQHLLEAMKWTRKVYSQITPAFPFTAEEPDPQSNSRSSVSVVSIICALSMRPLSLRFRAPSPSPRSICWERRRRISFVCRQIADVPMERFSLRAFKGFDLGSSRRGPKCGSSEILSGCQSPALL